MLRENDDISEIYIDPAQEHNYNSFAKFNGTHFDSIVIWQILLSPHKLKDYISWSTGAYFPMFDHFFSHGGLYNNLWKEYADFTIINFCLAQHKEIEKAGFSSHYIQYFPKPQEISTWGNDKELFFWQRIGVLNVSTIAAALKNYHLNGVHIHKVLDPGHDYSPPKDYGCSTENYFKTTTITESEWFETKDDLHNELQKRALYMAPRFYEGIGMSFLEAMAFGRCVIAPNVPTMNEYIKDGETGILYNWNENSPSKCDTPIDLSSLNIQTIQENTHKYIANGYASWNKNKKLLLDWIFETPQPNKKELEKSAITYGWKDWGINEQQRPNKKELEDLVISKKPQSVAAEKQNPDVSVITIVYNAIKDGRKEMLLQNLESVQSQKDLSIEHLIVDGGSIDGTKELILDFKNDTHPIRFISKTDNGVYDAMNRGIVLAKGDYIVFLNSGNYYHNPFGLSDAVTKLHKTRCEFSFSPITMIGDGFSDHPHTSPHKHLQDIFLYSVFSHQSILVKRETLIKMHGFDLSYKSASNYDLVLRMILLGHKGCYVPNNFVSYRKIEGKSTNIHLSAHETALVYKRLYNKHIGASLTENEAYILHAHRIVPANDPEILTRLRKKTEKTFVGVPQKIPYSYKKEWKFIWDCLRHRKLHRLRDFLIVFLNSRFDSEWYLETYKEVEASKISPAEHYMLLGWREGRDPSKHFSTKGYLEKNPDVAEMDLCPLIHWKLKGKKEKRKW